MVCTGKKEKRKKMAVYVRWHAPSFLSTLLDILPRHTRRLNEWLTDRRLAHFPEKNATHKTRVEISPDC